MIIANAAARTILHLGQNHGADLLGLEPLGLALILDLDLRLVPGAREHLERPVLDVRLDRGVADPPADQPLCVVHSVLAVPGGLVDGGLPDQLVVAREGHDARGRPVALVIGDDLHLSVLKHPDARIRGPEVDPDHGALNLAVVVLAHRLV